MHSSTSILAAAGLLSLAFAAPISQDVEERATVTYGSYGQCGGGSFVSNGVCPSGQVCVYTNEWYSQCLPGTATNTTKAAVKLFSAIKVVTSSPKVVVKSTSTSSKAVIKSTSTSSKAIVAASTAASKGLQWLGVTESGAEFGTSAIPGTLGTDYTWPETSSIQALLDSGMNIIRIPFLMERLAQGTMTATLDATYLAALTKIATFVTSAGAHVVLDPHNFGRYAGNTFTSTSDFKTFWTNVATVFKSNDLVIFDCMNEFHDEPTETTVAELSQACINGVRAAGATSQYIFIEGTSYTGAWTWTTSGNSANLGSLTDPSNKIIYEMHQYLDSDGSGTSETCVSTTIGVERIAAATAWLRANGKKGVIGEFAGGANTVCQTAVTGLLDSLVANNDVWLGAMAWAAGPWWGSYHFSMEPGTGTGYNAYIAIFKKYAA